MAKISSIKEREREFIAEIIQIYRNSPALWNMKSKMYYNREKKNMAYNLLLTKYRERYPDATKDDIKKKINCLRTNYLKEVKKLNESIKSSSSTDSVYQPTLWYFNEFNFLHEEQLASDSESSMDNNQKSEDSEPRYIELNPENQVFMFDDNNDSRVHDEAPRRTFEKRIAKSIKSKKKVINLAYEHRSGRKHGYSFDDIKDSRVHNVAPHKPLKNHFTKTANNEDKHTYLAHEHFSEGKDEHNYWAMACAADLRKMDWTQQLYAKKAIAEIIMEGQLGLLHRNSVKINESQIDTQYISSSYNPIPSPTDVKSSPEQIITVPALSPT